MKIKIHTLLLIALFFSCSKIFSKPFDLPVSLMSTAMSNKIINSSDSVIFDLANATITATYIDVPVSIKSDDVIYGLDYEMQFNLSKLTFSTTIDLITNDSSFFPFSYFNSSDLYLRYTASTFLGFPSNGTTITIIRFALNTTCVPVTASDFSNMTTVLNGFPCPKRVTTLNFSQYIPVASFSKGPACLNALTQLTDLSAIVSGSISAYSWNFGNGNFSSMQNPTTSYTATGTYTAILSLTSAIGCTSTASSSVVVSALPTVTINPAGTVTVCPLNPITFTASATLVAYLWSNGAITPTISVAGSGTYSLQVIDNAGCTANSAGSVTVINVLPADFNADGTVDTADFLIFNAVFDSLCTCAADMNKDGTINTDDFLLFAPLFNSSCQ